MTPWGEALLTPRSLPTWIQVSYLLYKLQSIPPANNLFPKVFQLLYLISCTYQLNQSILKEINPTLHWKNWCWSWSSNTLATWCKKPAHWERPWCWERLRAGGEGDNRGWDGWMASPTQWAWVWASSRSWWWTGRPGMLQSMGSQSWTQLSDWTVRMEILPSFFTIISLHLEQYLSSVWLFVAQWAVADPMDTRLPCLPLFPRVCS